MKRILISPFSQKMRNGCNNPKNYPYWKEIVSQLKAKGFYVIQVGVTGEEDIGASEKRFNPKLKELKELLDTVDLWLSVDNFFNHFASYYKKRGIVIFGKSDPLIYGYPQNINILKDRKYLRQFQFDIWEKETFSEEVFVTPNIVLEIIYKELGVD